VQAIVSLLFECEGRLARKAAADCASAGQGSRSLTEMPSVRHTGQELRPGNEALSRLPMHLRETTAMQQGSKRGSRVASGAAG